MGKVAEGGRSVSTELWARVGCPLWMQAGIEGSPVAGTKGILNARCKYVACLRLGQMESFS